jgi:signal transduction histidine kinase/ActR/RegA family two-component response regulator
LPAKPKSTQNNGAFTSSQAFHAHLRSSLRKFWWYQALLIATLTVWVLRPEHHGILEAVLLISGFLGITITLFFTYKKVQRQSTFLEYLQKEESLLRSHLEQFSLIPKLSTHPAQSTLDELIIRTWDAKDSLQQAKYSLEENKLAAQLLIRMAEDMHTLLLQLQKDSALISSQFTQLKHLHHVLDNVVNSMPSMLVGVNTDFIIQQWNKQAQDVTGVAPTVAINQSVYKVLPFLKDMQKDLALAIEQAKPTNLGFKTCTINNSTRELLVWAFPLHDSQAKEMVIRLDDVTEIRMVTRELHQRQKLDSIGHLAGGVAHDFNNMLSTISGACELMNLPDEEVENKEYRRIIIDTVVRASELTRKLLSFARKGKQDNRPIDIHSLVKDVTTIFARSSDKRIEISLQLMAINHFVLGDASELQNAILNLVINAKDAMPQGGVINIRTSIADVHLSVQKYKEHNLQEGSYLCIEIEDNGEGIPDHILPQIFDPFFTTKGLGKGTGLGLSGVYGAMQQHNGAIFVKSSPNQGTTFELLLPLYSGEFQVANTIIDESAPRQGTILVADDEVTIRLIFKRMLERMGYTVLLACDGEEAVHLYEENAQRIDMIMLDMRMPKMDGAQAFRAIRAQNPNAHVVICSGFDSDDSIKDLFAEGLLEYLPKPLSWNDLKKTLAAVMPMP